VTATGQGRIVGAVLVPPYIGHVCRGGSRTALCQFGQSGKGRLVSRPYGTRANAYPGCSKRHPYEGI